MAYFQVGDLKVGLFAVLVAVLIVLVSVALKLQLYAGRPDQISTSLFG